jgi:CBS domain-containing protein
VLNDRICQRISDIVRKRHHLDRISWCWLAFGSEGRLEQTFATDQDNGLIFEAHGGIDAREARSQLLPFAHAVNEALDACGFPLCPGNVMASNPGLCLSVREWRATIEHWLNESDPKALLDAATCLDFRSLHGDARLATDLRTWLVEVARTRQTFLRLLAEDALQARPPLGRWRDLTTENAPNAPRSINLKLYGVRPFVDRARVLALANGVPHTATAERLRGAAAAGALSPVRSAASEAAFFFIPRTRLWHQAGLEQLSPATANRIDPARLNQPDRRTLKEAFRIGRDLQQRLALDYQL